jgi:hypothetical protein
VVALAMTQVAELVGAHELDCRWLHLKGLDAANIPKK